MSYLNYYFCLPANILMLFGEVRYINMIIAFLRFITTISQIFHVSSFKSCIICVYIMYILLVKLNTCTICSSLKGGRKSFLILFCTNLPHYSKFNVHPTSVAKNGHNMVGSFFLFVIHSIIYSVVQKEPIC